MGKPPAYRRYARIGPILVLGSLFFGFLILTSHAQPAGTGFRHDSDQPIEIVSDSLEITKDQETAIFQGNVKAIQGRMSLSADTVRVKYRQTSDGPAGETSPFSRIDASGNVVLMSPEENATGDWAIYEVDSKTITLGGTVVLTRGNNVVRGRRLVVNLATGQSRIDSGGAEAGQQRVRATFMPKKKDGAE